MRSFFDALRPNTTDLLLSFLPLMRSSPEPHMKLPRMFLRLVNSSARWRETSLVLEPTMRRTRPENSKLPRLSESS